MSTPRRSLSGGAALMSASQVVIAGTGFATTVIVARLLGPAGIGAFTLALSLSLILGFVGSLGLENGVAYLVGAGRWSPRRAFAESQAVAVVMGALAMGLAAAVREIAPGAFQGLTLVDVLIVGAGFGATFSWQYVRYLAIALDHYEGFALPPAAYSTLALVLVGVLTAIWGLTGAIVGLTIAQVATALASAWWASRALLPGGPALPEKRSGRLREALSFGVRSNAAQALQFVNYRLDLFVLSAVASQTKLGLYSVAVSVTSVMYLAPQTLSLVMFPRVAQLSAGGEVDVAERAMVEAKGLRHVALLTLVLLPVLAAALVVGVPLLYGGGFSDAVLLGLILLPGMAFFGLSAVLTATTNGRGHPGYSLAVAAMATPPTIVAYLVLIPALQGTGAALASTASYVLTCVLAALFYRRATGDRVLALLIPTRSELADYAALWSRLRSRAA